MAEAKILIVDDNPDLIAVLKVRLESFGYEVVVAEDGVKCLEKASSGKPDLILLDVLMPEMDGFQALKKLKEDDLMKTIPVIMLTAKDKLDDVAKANALGAADFIVKPFDYRIMVEKIRKILKN
ncbi:MAG: response regulator [Candidatus Omnitrophica bacterium]|nr:response regulator [Candidatus Omnitrophota bacterium]